MKQWSLRITAYADKLLKGLDTIQWSDSIKEIQKNWIGRSEGAEIDFNIEGQSARIKVFTTRPDTLFGATFMVIAPESDLINNICSESQKPAVLDYAAKAKNRSERERQAEVKNITGAFTGSYVKHPFTNEEIPIWIGDYVIASYGGGAVMVVPAHDKRDYDFSKKYGFKIKEVPIKFVDRKIGASKMTKGIIKEAILGVLHMQWQASTGKFIKIIKRIRVNF